ncbi:MAG: hypothetical protein ACTTG8_07350 [Catonella sp.]|uniref:hypothetical protein n=1 Tax=Catonella sp. TaxID=2382125 RepID=UPI003FA073A0
MNINEENNNKANISNEVCKGCGWQCPINELSCNKGRRLNGVPEIVASIPVKRPSSNPKIERFLHRLNRSGNE